ncbi:hypothetical protein K505DRAFT_15576 [Melanomma pulvis-pyrius CBS 109.77]|uniref:Uncharacterized protein n=1 Tax=Melanomma pulvis-pyrius CBS 109.77 TaxID=1314802 RepID=A0A6A6WNQ5_9PLEO|nr:hypothetical protein K505DRAFT_15576 [Melanomma pulvis-pyrius CBS 109.77]
MPSWLRIYEAFFIWGEGLSSCRAISLSLLHCIFVSWLVLLWLLASLFVPGLAGSSFFAHTPSSIGILSPFSWAFSRLALMLGRKGRVGGQGVMVGLGTGQTWIPRPS